MAGPGVALTDREGTRHRIVSSIPAWLGTSTWPAYSAAGITAAYGMLKAYWVFGGTSLWSIAPLDPEMIMVLRALLSIPGDVYEIASGGALTHTALWDLALWSPLFLIWGLLWAPTALTYTRRSRRSGVCGR